VLLLACRWPAACRSDRAGLTAQPAAAAHRWAPGARAPAKRSLTRWSSRSARCAGPPG
jgi:hypothetical protein